MTPLHRFRVRPKRSRLRATASLGPATNPTNRNTTSLLRHRPRTVPVCPTPLPPNDNLASAGGPQGPLALQASSSGPEQAEIARLQAVIATMAGSPAQHAYAGMPEAHHPYSHVSLLSSARPRPFYCWLHGYNNTHDGATCNVMRANPEYTAYQKNAASPDGTGGNPNVGVPVSFTRPRSKFFSPLSRACLPCLTQPMPNFNPPPPTARLSKIVLTPPPMMP